jgi:adenosylcobinamide-GDP ribazoletransferase
VSDQPSADGNAQERFRQLAAAPLQALRFYSRLPVPVLPFEANPHHLPDFARIGWAVPIAGFVIGAAAALVAALALWVQLSPWIAAILAIATGVIITGCFHEDGLADSCDGLWGGVTPERRLDIMKDSRIGSYGAAALGLSLMLRAAAMAELFRLMGPAGAWLLPGIAAVSRSAALVPTLLIPPARTGGLAAAAPMPGWKALFIALAIGLCGLALGLFQVDLLVGVFVGGLALVPALLVAIFTMKRKVGGYTGDLLGATQQLAEMALLMAIAASAAARGPF